MLGVEKAKLSVMQKSESSPPAAPVSPTGLAAKALAAKDSAIASLKTSMSENFGFAKDIMQVHFNPSTIKFKANTSPVPARSYETNQISTIPMTRARESSISMDVDLVFDNSPSNLIHAGVKIARSFAKGLLDGKYSVLKETQGLIATLNSVNTKRVSFIWAKLNFTGIVERINAKYTMFSQDGEPLRSTVSLTLSQCLEDSDNAYWEKAFDNFFGEADSADSYTRGKNLSQEMQKMINIKF